LRRHDHTLTRTKKADQAIDWVVYPALVLDCARYHKDWCPGPPLIHREGTLAIIYPEIP